MAAVDEKERLGGMLRRAVVEEAELKRANRQFLRISGIIGAEDFRSMSLLIRAGWRLSRLSMNTVVNGLAGKLDDSRMQKLNYEVDEKKRSPADVAREFLQSQGLVN